MAATVPTVPPSSLDDPASPFFLHGENPGVVLVSQPLIGENYNTWSRLIIIALSAMNKLQFIDGSLPRPSFETGAEHPAWERCNNMILYWILNSVSKEIASSIIYISTCEAMWLYLKKRFSPKSGPRAFQLQKSISDLTQEKLVCKFILYPA